MDNSSKEIVNDYKILSDIIKINNINEITALLSYYKTQTCTLQNILVFLIENKCSIDIIKIVISIMRNVNYEIQENKIPLFIAIKENQFKVANLLLQNHADINLLNNHHENILSYLFKLKKINSLQLYYLLKNGINVNEIDNEGNTCLMNAIKFGDHHLIELILNYFTCDTEDIIDIILYYKSHKKYVIEYIENKVKEKKGKIYMNVKNDDNDTVLIFACRQNNLDIVKKLLQYGNISINEKGEDKKTALIWAIYRENIDIAQHLLSYGADINIKDFYGMSPLSHACQSGNYNLVEFLLNQGADINIKDNNGLSSLIYSITNDNDKVSRLLIERGIYIHDIDNMGKIPLTWSSQSNNLLITELLLNQGSNINHRDHHGATSLMYACQQRNKYIVELLLKYGADIHLKDEDEKTCLIYSIVYGNNDIIKFLLINGCDINSKDKFGKSALMYAIENDFEEIIEILFNLNANVFDCDNNQKSILDYIKENDNKDIIELYMKKKESLKSNKTIS
ncbi:ankyrin [Piromyces finnis]|uniref:Ankyrin n=1 Tax=Piromyces finnis TaxID=1754191 RepID=A0A1Y1V2L7_9FUNG|nr:ankyrin [Piromyces finnis]|eukprot:ORX45812.1 ankyrin [Piromyces finnis]